MSLTVNTNVASLQAMHQVTKTQDGLSSTIERISSGLRVNRAADDAAGLGVATNLNTQVRSTRQAMRNANDGISLIQTAEGATDGVTDILDRMRELAVQSASESLHDDERAYIQDEFTQLSSEIDRISASTEFNGTALADGSTATISVQVGIHNNTNSQISVTLGDLRGATLGVDTLSIGLDTSANALAAIDAVDTALDTVNGYRSDFGSVQNRIDSAISNASNYVENLSAAESRIRDADYAYETAEMSKLQIMSQAGIASLAQAKGISQGVVSLLN